MDPKVSPTTLCNLFQFLLIEGLDYAHLGCGNFRLGVGIVVVARWWPGFVTVVIVVVFDGRSHSGGFEWSPGGVQNLHFYPSVGAEVGDGLPEIDTTVRGILD